MMYLTSVCTYGRDGRLRWQRQKWNEVIDISISCITTEQKQNNNKRLIERSTGLWENEQQRNKYMNWSEEFILNVCL